MESEKIAEWIHRTEFEDIPEVTIEVVKRAFLDTIGVILAANTLGEACRPFVEIAIEKGGKRESTVLGFGAKVPSHMAAFANGAMVHALDFEDAHDAAGVHSNAATIPAALALAESLSSISGRQFLTALVLGSEIVCRLGLALKTNLLHYGWYPPPILGAFGATVASSKLLNLDCEQILDALSLCLCQSVCPAEIVSSPKSLIRGVRDAFAAKAGVLSAILAKRGVKGFDHPFEGEFGFFNLYAKGEYEKKILLSGLGEIYECTNISFKPWPSCRGTHAYIEGVLRIKKENQVRSKEIERINAVVGEKSVTIKLCEPLDSKRKPQTAIDAKFSIPFTVSLAVCFGDVRLQHFTSESLNDRNVLEMAKKVEYTISPSFDWRTSNPGIIEVYLKDGRRFKKEVEFPYGHPKNPMAFEDLKSKFLECVRYSHKPIEEKAVNELIEKSQSLEMVKDMRELTRVL